MIPAKNKKIHKAFLRPSEVKENKMVNIINYSSHKEIAKIGIAERIQEIMGNWKAAENTAKCKLVKETQNQDLNLKQKWGNNYSLWGSKHISVKMTFAWGILGRFVPWRHSKSEMVNITFSWIQEWENIPI